MLRTYLKTHWFALLLSAGAFTVPFVLPQTNLTLVLLGLTVLVWGLTTALTLRYVHSAITTRATSDATRLNPKESGDVLDQSEFPHHEGEIKEERALVHGLVNDVHRTVQHEVIFIRNEIYRIRTLVSDAVSQLSDSFQGLSERSESQQKMLMSVIENLESEALASGDSVSKSLSDISDLAKQINDHIGQVIRALQFEDIVSQRLEHPLQRLDILKGFVNVLKDNLDELATIAATTEVDYCIRLQQVRDQLSQAMETRDVEDEAMVQHQSMEAGSIDLF